MLISTFSIFSNSRTSPFAMLSHSVVVVTSCGWVKQNQDLLLCLFVTQFYHLPQHRKKKLCLLGRIILTQEKKKYINPPVLLTYRTRQAFQTYIATQAALCYSLFCQDQDPSSRYVNICTTFLFPPVSHQTKRDPSESMNYDMGKY